MRDEISQWNEARRLCLTKYLEPSDIQYPDKATVAKDQCHGHIDRPIIAYESDVGRSKALLILSTITPNVFSYKVLQSAASSSSAWTLVLAWITTSLPAFAVGRRTAFVNSEAEIPRKWHTFSTSAGDVMLACSALS